MNLFASNLFGPNAITACMQLLVVVFSVSLHEYMHARVALSQGDDTAANAGHLTLNPFKQMGGWSLLMLLLLGICWGSVPVNPLKMRRKYSALLVAMAGPLTNLALFFLFSMLFVALWASGGAYATYEPTYRLLTLGAIMNFALFLINILPIPGLDGWHLVSPFLPYEKLMRSEFLKGAMLVVLVLAFTFARYLFLAAERMTELVISGGASLLRALGIGG